MVPDALELHVSFDRVNTFSHANVIQDDVYKQIYMSNSVYIPVAISTINLLFYRLVIVAVTLSMEPFTGIPSTASNQSQPLDWMKAADDEGVLVEQHCRPALQLLLLIHTALLALSLLLEISMAWLALQGTMWNVAPRRLMEHVLYSRLSTYIHHKLVSRPHSLIIYVVFFHSSATIFFSCLVVLVAGLVWSSFCIVWLQAHYVTCSAAGASKEVLLGKNKGATTACRQGKVLATVVV